MLVDSLYRLHVCRECYLFAVFCIPLQKVLAVSVERFGWGYAQLLALDGQRFLGIDGKRLTGVGIDLLVPWEALLGVEQLALQMVDAVANGLDRRR